jgi:hypothetical protein
MRDMQAPPCLKFEFDVQHPPAAIRLDGFPLLAHSPQQWGQGVRTEDNGTRVDAIVAAHKGDFAATAAQFKTTEKHVRQALAYSLMIP